MFELTDIENSAYVSEFGVWKVFSVHISKSNFKNTPEEKVPVTKILRCKRLKFNYLKQNTTVLRHLKYVLHIFVFFSNTVQLLKEKVTLCFIMSYMSKRRRKSLNVYVQYYSISYYTVADAAAAGNCVIMFV